ncbi:MAG: hypothetical protein ACOYNN_17960 [Terrimicrobiaceae bacterium]
MNEDNVSIDVQAETQAFSSAISPSSLAGASENSPQPTMELPEAIPYAANVEVELPDPLPIKPTEVDVKNQTVAEVAKVAVGLDVKFDAESAIKNVQASVSDLESSVSDTMGSIMSRWLPNPRPVSNFEERPTTDPSNLIFEARRDRFSQYPKWA